MEFEQIVKIIELLISIIGVILVGVGLVAPFYQSLELNKINQKNTLELNKVTQENALRQKQLEWKINILNEQISKCYGPISAILMEQEIISDKIWFVFGRKAIFDHGKDKLSDLTPDEQKIWVHFVDNYKIPLQHKILEILQRNKHLLVQNESSASIDRFMDYALGWELLDSQARHGVPNYYEYYYSFNYPVDFNKHIKRTLKELIENRDKLIAQMG